MAKLEDQYDALYKLVLIGDSGVGKTNLLGRFLINQFVMESRPTIGVEFATKTVSTESQTIKTQIWDTAGQERFRAITNAYYRGAVGSLIVYDITKRSTFENVQKWLKELQENSHPSIAIILIGNKKDLGDSRQVTQEEAQQLAQEKNLLFIETSAKEAENVEAAFMEVIKEIMVRPDLNNKSPMTPQSPKIRKIDSKPLEPITKKEKKKGCC